MAAALKQQVLEEPHPHFLLLISFIFFGSSILHIIKSKAQDWQKGSVPHEPGNLSSSLRIHVTAAGGN